jgi:hypothetical protein
MSRFRCAWKALGWCTLRKRFWFISAILALISVWFGLKQWNDRVPIRIKQITWVAPTGSGWLYAIDLDNDGNGEVIVEASGHYWWLRIEGDKCVAEEMPVKHFTQINNTEMLKTALPVIQNGRLLLLRKRGKWVWQRVAENVNHALVTDLDGDSKWDDLIVLKLRPRCQIIWFEIDFEGYAHFRDAVSFPKPSHNNIWLWDRDQAVEIMNGNYTIWVWDGRLRGDKGSWILKREDLNGDGKDDLIRMKKEWQRSLVQIVANLSGQDEEVSLTLKKLWLRDQIHFGDLNGDGRKELLALGDFSYSPFLFRFWIEGRRWRWEQIRVGAEREFAGMIRVKNRDWFLLWNSDQGKLVAIWREKSGWKRKIWRFRVTRWSTLHRAMVKQDDKGWFLVMTRIQSLEQHPFWGRWLQIVERLRQNKVPVPPFLLPTKWDEFRQVWRWDEQKLSWKLEQLIHEDDWLLRIAKQVANSCYLDCVAAVDLDKDGVEEKLICDNHTGGCGYLAVKVGRLWKQWRIVPLWKEQHYNIVILEQKEKNWIVALDCVTRINGTIKRILRAWTLEK